MSIGSLLLGIEYLPNPCSNSQSEAKEQVNALQITSVKLPFQRRSFVVVPDLGIIPNKVQRHVHKMPPDTTGEQ